MNRPLVILDRDGVINHDRHDYIKHRDEWQPLPGAIEAISRLSQAGYDVAIATNQSGLARGLIPKTELDAMHVRLQDLVSTAGGRIAHIAFCPHHPDDDCDCRKPRSGLLKQIAQTLSIPTLNTAWMVGDSLRDLQAGDAMGTKLALVLTGNGQQTQAKLTALGHPEKVWVCQDLAAFVDRLLTDSVSRPTA